MAQGNVIVVSYEQPLTRKILRILIKWNLNYISWENSFRNGIAYFWALRNTAFPEVKFLLLLWKNRCSITDEWTSVLLVSVNGLSTKRQHYDTAYRSFVTLRWMTQHNTANMPSVTFYLLLSLVLWCHLHCRSIACATPGNTKRGSITVPLSSCLTWNQLYFWQFLFIFKTGSTGGQWYSDTSPSIPWLPLIWLWFKT